MAEDPPPWSVRNDLELVPPETQTHPLDLAAELVDGALVLVHAQRLRLDAGCSILRGQALVSMSPQTTGLLPASQPASPCADSKTTE